MKILVAGATGYIGGRLVPRLLEAGHEVRCLARRPGKLDELPWRDRVEVVQGDVLEPKSLKEAASGCDAAFYLVHSMEAGGDFEDLDRTGAENFRAAADAVALRRVVYLGGLGPDDEELSPHLGSRQEVGRILASGATPVTELRAAVIIGSGSLSFEMLRYLTEVLPIMTTPTWVRTDCQPIAVRDVLEMLVAAVEEEGDASRVVEVGGPDVLSYQDMMKVYAEEAGLRKRIIVPVPVLSPGLSSLWVGLVTPLPPSVARPLVDSLRHEVVVTTPPPDGLLPPAETSYRDAVRRALQRPAATVESRWTDAGSVPALPAIGDPEWSGGTVLTDIREISTDAEPRHLFWAFSRIGGNVGYYGLNWAWRLRGVLDQLFGGVGLRRGRRHPEELREGDAVDFWRVEFVERERRLRLHAEMRLPGEAYLEWEIVPTDEGSDLVQRAIFLPRGLFGRLYWYVLVPFHTYIFPRMARRIAATAEERGYACP
ncbi:MAG: SDR family oxidoreductase [Acidimicrobiia bacterium]|nr:SDR family oxidoreductase [Acidimicrobiia bacterium]